MSWPEILPLTGTSAIPPLACAGDAPASCSVPASFSVPASSGDRPDTSSTVRSCPEGWAQGLGMEHSLVGVEIPEWYMQRIDALLLLVEAEFRQLAPQKSDSEIWIAARTLWAGIHGISMAALTSTPVIKKPDISRQIASSLIENYLAGFLR